MTRGLCAMAAAAVAGFACAQSPVSPNASASPGIRLTSVQYRPEGQQSIQPLGEGLPATQPTAMQVAPVRGTPLTQRPDGGTEVPADMMAVPDAQGLNLLVVPSSASQTAPSRSSRTGGLRLLPPIVENPQSAAPGTAQGIPILGEGLPVTVEPPVVSYIQLPGASSSVPASDLPPAQENTNTGGLRLLPPVAENVQQEQGGAAEGIPAMDEGLPMTQAPAAAAQEMLQPGPVPDAETSPMDPLAVEQGTGGTGDRIPKMGLNVIGPKPDAVFAEPQTHGMNVPGPVYDPNAPIKESDEQQMEPAGSSSIPAMDGNVTLPEPKSVSQEELDAALRKAGPPVRPASDADAALAKNPQANGPVNVRGWDQALAMREVDMPGNGTCQSVRPGDRVHFTLRVENAAEARHVFTNLLLALGHPRLKTADLPLSGGNTLGGGGVGQRDSNDSQLYHFSFLVPLIDSGIYRTSAIDVRATFGVARNAADAGIGVPLDRHSREQVRVYCLAVFGGTGSGGHQPIVTEFNSDPVEHAAVPVEQPVFSYAY